VGRIWGDVNPTVLVSVTLRFDPLVLWNCHHNPAFEDDWSAGSARELNPVFVSRYMTLPLLEERVRLVALTSVVTYRHSVGAVSRILFVAAIWRFKSESIVSVP
jgi:hypothetical protein